MEWQRPRVEPLSSECGTYKTVTTRFWPPELGLDIQAKVLKTFQLVSLRAPVYLVIYDSG